MQKALVVAALSVPLLMWCCRKKKTPTKDLEPFKACLKKHRRKYAEDDVDETAATTIMVENGSRKVKGTILDEKNNSLSAAVPFLSDDSTDMIESSAVIKHRLNRIFTSLDVAPSDCSVMATYSTPFNRDQFARLAFEYYKVPKLYLTTEAQLALQSCGRTTGIVVDIGRHRTVVTPIYSDLVCERMIKSASFGTIDIIKHASKMLSQQRCCIYDTLSSAEQLESAKFLVDTFGYVNPKPNTAKQRRRMYPIKMNGNINGIVNTLLDRELYEPLELLFTNKIRTIHDCLRDSIDHGRPEIRDVMRNNIVLTGEIRSRPGLKERLEFELHRAQPHSEFNVIISPPNNLITGGKAQCSTIHPQQWITKEEYDLNGLELIAKRCF